jgi:hypothetical protein
MAAKRGRGGNLSTLIREYFGSNPNAGPTEVVKALAEKKITVTPTLVSNVKARMLKGSTGVRGRRPGRRPKAGGQHVSVSALVEAKRFADHVGSVEAALQALDTLSKLR